MATGNFERCLAETLAHEGGWSDHPDDPGGATMRGVTLATYRRRRPGATKADLRAITRAELAAIYREEYWLPAGCETLAPGVDLATFDYAVNSGPETARKNLVAVLGGPDHKTVQRLCARRLSIYRGFKHWKTFGEGWARRVAAVEAKGVAWALTAVGSPGTAKVVLKTRAEEADRARSRAAGASGAWGGASAGAATSVAIAPDAAGADLALLLVVMVLGAAAALILWRRRRIEAERARAFAALAREVG